MKKLKTLYKKYEHRLSLIAFLFGFVVDNFTLTRIDLLFDNLVLATYLTIAGLGIFVFNYFKNKKVIGRIAANIIPFTPLLIQFAFGGLFSGYFIFYSRSASLASSWLFIVLILTLLIGNEYFKKKYDRLEFQISIFFITLFSFFIFYIPILVKTMGAWVFILSGFVSLVAIRIFVFLLARAIPKEIHGSQKQLVMSILSIYFAFNFLYFANIIPPIPLSLKDAEIYYSVERTSEGYEVYSEKLVWYKFYKNFTNDFYKTQNKPIYFYSSVFAPTDLNIDILHKWQYFDENKEEWIESDRLKFSIVGGRDGGYRGFSKKSNIAEGKWRVDIITAREQVIGRYVFNVSNVDITPELERELK